jgi:hypothetical protein
VGDGFGKIFVLLLAIGLIFLAASRKGKAIFDVLRGGVAAPATATSTPYGGYYGTPQPTNPTDLRQPGSTLGETDATKGGATA